MFHRIIPLKSPIKVDMPNHEKAYILVLEYVAGFTLYQLANAFSEEDPEHDDKRLVSEV